MLTYPVRLVPTREGNVRAVFPDVPQAAAEGRDEEDALYRARFVLEMCLGHLLARGERPPRPSDICGAPTVTTDKFTRVREDADTP
jgi:predicted RNase H-like HicB family nuclease